MAELGKAKAVTRILAAILKSQAKRVIGDETLQAISGELASLGKESLDKKLDDWLSDRGAQIAAAEERAIQCFQEKCRETGADEELTQWMRELPLDQLPKVVKAIEALPRRMDESELEGALREEIRQAWKKLARVQIEQAVATYMRCLRQALAGTKDFQPTIVAITVLKQLVILETVRDNVSDIQQKLYTILARLEGKVETTKVYLPPELPEKGVLPEPGELPPGSRMPFPRNQVFTGREKDLQALAEALLYEEDKAVGIVGTPRATAATGMGGIGKTQLAVEFCYRYGRFFQGVHWIQAPSLERGDAKETKEERSGFVLAELATCGEKMGLEYWPAEVPEQVRLTLQAWERGGVRLVVWDNLEDPELVQEWLPRLGNVRLLLTSRRREWPKDLVATRALDILERGESVVLLRKLAERLEKCADGELGDLAERLGDLPLALDLAGRHLNQRKRLSPKTYLAEIESMGNALEHSSLAGWKQYNPTLHETNLAATYLISWEAIESELARKLFLFCGYCAANVVIPWQVLQAVSGEETQEDAVDKAANELEKLGLVACSEVGATVHPILNEFGRIQDKANEESLLPGLAESIIRLANMANNSGYPERFKPLRAHVEAVGRWVEVGDPTTSAALWNSLGYHLQATGDYAGARPYYEQALAIRLEALGEKHPDTARVLNNLGTLLDNMGDYAGARPYHERALAIRREVLGEKHPDTASSLNNLGYLLQATGDYAGARPYYEQALAIRREVLGEKHPDTARCLNNLGYLLNAMGNYAEALPYHEQALAIRREVLGEKHRDITSSLNNLGFLLQATGDYAGAQPYFEQALAIRREVLGEKHPDTATSLNNLGALLEKMGDYARARPYYEQALAIRREVLGEKHPDTANSLNNLGGLLQAIGDYAGARSHFEQALANCREILGEKHPDTTHCLNNLGYLLQAMGDYARARPHFEQALAIRREVLGEKHPDTANSLNNLGMLLASMGDYAGARIYIERGLAILEAVLPAKHPDIQIVRGNLEEVKGKLAGESEG